MSTIEAIAFVQNKNNADLEETAINGEVVTDGNSILYATSKIFKFKQDPNYEKAKKIAIKHDKKEFGVKIKDEILFNGIHPIKDVAGRTRLYAVKWTDSLNGDGLQMAKKL